MRGENYGARNAAALVLTASVFLPFYFSVAAVSVMGTAILLSFHRRKQAFQEPWADWAGYSTPPAGVAVEASPEQEQNLLEVEIWIAVDEKEK